MKPLKLMKPEKLLILEKPVKSLALRSCCLAALLSVLVLTGCGKGSSDPVPSASPEPVLQEAEPTPVPTPTPTPTPTYDLNFSIGDQKISASVTSLDLSQADADDVDRLIEVLPALTSLRTLELGSADAENPVISWEQVRALEEGLPQAAINYTFSIRGYPFKLSDQILNLNHLIFEDEGELAEQIASCMPNLKVLDMDSCGVSNESMAAIRDRFPGVDVVWRVWIGADYSTRTNVERLMISNPDRGGDLNTPESIEGLFYCNKIKYLDMGHNYLMTDISFIRNMPDLEALIIAMTAIKDISPLAGCKNLNYLEYQTSAACDLSPLSGLTKLKDLNICYNFALRDIRPIMDLDLDRLYIGCLSPVPPEQIAQYRQLHPNCIVNDTTEDPTEESWRYGDIHNNGGWEAAPRYEKLRLEFEYDNFPTCYAYRGNDGMEFGRFEYDPATLKPNVGAAAYDWE